jgi:hypothetical protein
LSGSASNASARRALLRLHLKAGVVHLERLEEHRVEQAVEPLAGQALEEDPQHVGRDPILPARARLPSERDAREPLHQHARSEHEARKRSSSSGQDSHQVGLKVDVHRVMYHEDLPNHRARTGRANARGRGAAQGGLCWRHWRSPLNQDSSGE